MSGASPARNLNVRPAQRTDRRTALGAPSPFTAIEAVYSGFPLGYWSTAKRLRHVSVDHGRGGAHEKGARSGATRPCASALAPGGEIRRCAGQGQERGMWPSAGTGYTQPASTCGAKSPQYGSVTPGLSSTELRASWRLLAEPAQDSRGACREGNNSSNHPGRCTGFLESPGPFVEIHPSAGPYSLPIGVCGPSEVRTTKKPLRGD